MSAVLSVVHNTTDAAQGNNDSGAPAQGAIIETRYVPVSQLIPSPRNVRAQSEDKGDIPGLAAMILAQDLLQALSVVEVTGKGKGKKSAPLYEVDAGERRRCALMLLVEQGKISPDYEVLCNIIDSQRGREVSLAENTRQAMHPADEMQAFADLIKEGKTEEQVASIFGCTTLTIKRRLSLMNAAPELIQEFRQDKITQEQLQALVICPDHAKQVDVWNNAGYWNKTPAALRRAITPDEVSTASDTVAAFVGVEAFEAAGGEVRRDLFSDEAGEGYIQDKVLLDKVAAQLLEPTCEALRAEGWAWVEARPVCSQQDLRSAFVVGKKSHRDATEQEQAEFDRIDKRQQELQDEMDKLDEESESYDENYERFSEEHDTLEGQREELSKALEVWGDEVKSVGGAIVTIKEGSPPTVAIHRGLIRREDFAKTQAATGGEAGEGRGLQLDEQERAKPVKAEFSESLTRRLTSHRTAALQVMVARNVQVALAALAHSLVQNVFGTTYMRRSALEINASSSEHHMTSGADDMQESKAWAELEAIWGSWDRRLPDDPTELMGWLLGLPILELQSLIAVCTAKTINCIQGRPGPHHGDLLARAVGLDMADWWQATPESFFNHVPKAKMKAAVAEAMSEGAAETLDKLKKGEAANEASKLLEDRRWLPSVLRNPTLVRAGQEHAVQQDLDESDEANEGQ